METQRRALEEALSETQAARARTYYDEPADKRARTAYYRDLPRSGTPGTRFDRLSELLKRTHRPQLTYRPSAHVYPWVDLQVDGKLYSLYSGRAVTPEQFIRADFEIEQRRAQLAVEVRDVVRASATRFYGHSGRRSHADRADQVHLDSLQVLALLEAALPYNCEHVVPQSWFGAREPMRGDLHHLFACESRCNSFRGNTPYFDFPDFSAAEHAQAISGDCGKKVGDKFEPGAGKGVAARATLYFLLRYPGQINRVPGEYDESRLATIVAWHNAEPVTQYERHRNMAIFEKQGTRNPLIDFPEWATQVDFRRGLGG